MIRNGINRVCVLENDEHKESKKDRLGQTNHDMKTLQLHLLDPAVEQLKVRLLL
jgi:hypothetical protein